MSRQGAGVPIAEGRTLRLEPEDPGEARCFVIGKGLLRVSLATASNQGSTAATTGPLIGHTRVAVTNRMAIPRRARLIATCRRPTGDLRRARALRSAAASPRRP
jgi:hypothetical protein